MSPARPLAATNEKQSALSSQQSESTDGRRRTHLQNTAPEGRPNVARGGACPPAADERNPWGRSRRQCLAPVGATETFDATCPENLRKKTHFESLEHAGREAICEPTSWLTLPAHGASSAIVVESRTLDDGLCVSGKSASSLTSRSDCQGQSYCRIPSLPATSSCLSWPSVKTVFCSRDNRLSTLSQLR